MTTGSEQALVEDWCQQYPSQSIGTVEFGADGKLYASGGDGASFNFVDYGQDGNPLNPCGDPPGGVGATLSPPTAEGGALRSQDLRTSGDPVSLDGSIIRVDPATGAAPADNPLVSDPDANAKRIIAYGQRNPFRPGTNELWAGDVGWNTWEEINRGSSSIAGLDFQFAASTTNYPAEYDGALFFADHSRDCIWVMHKARTASPLPARSAPSWPERPTVNLEIGPGGDLFYADVDGGTIRRIRYTSSMNQPPTAVASATPTSGSAPLTVKLQRLQLQRSQRRCAHLRLGPGRRWRLR